MPELETASSQGRPEEEITPTEQLDADAQEAGEHEQTEGDANQVNDETQRRNGTSGVQKLKSRLERARLEAEFWKDEALKSRQTPAEASKETKQEPDGPPAKPVRPKLSDFETIEKYETALSKYEDDRDNYHEKKLEYELRKSETVREQQSAIQEVANSFAAQVDEAKGEFADFDEVAYRDDIPMSPVMRDAIVTSDVGAFIAYELGKNPTLAEKIYRMEPLAAVREIGKIESRIEAKRQAEEKQESAPTSRAPRPVSPVRRQSASSSDPEDADDYKTWLKKREAQLRAK